MAALDWGAGYGSIRIAQVEALRPGTVLVITPERLRDVLARSPAARDMVEQTARRRLAETSDG
jgi:CRP-like cAMP-binding protein